MLRFTGFEVRAPFEVETHGGHRARAALTLFAEALRGTGDHLFVHLDPQETHEFLGQPQTLLARTGHLHHGATRQHGLRRGRQERQCFTTGASRNSRSSSSSNSG
jgi:hypothetical protein